MTAYKTFKLTYSNNLKLNTIIDIQSKIKQ